MILQVWGKYFWLRSRHTEEDHEVQAAKDMQDMLRYDDGKILLIEANPQDLTYYAEVETKQYTPDRWKSFGIRTSRKDKYEQVSAPEEPWNVRLLREREERQRQDAQPPKTNPQIHVSTPTQPSPEDTVKVLSNMLERAKEAIQARKKSDVETSRSPEDRQASADAWYKERNEALEAAKKRWAANKEIPPIY